MEDVREANKYVSGDSWMPVLGELNEKPISIAEVREAVNEMGSRTGWISSGVFKERWYGSVRISNETVERKF